MNILKSGEFKGRLSSRWVRNNTGRAFFVCPKCNVEFYSTEQECDCGKWDKIKSGFRYRLIAKFDADPSTETETETGVI